MKESEVLYEFKYKISLDDYKEFNEKIAMKSIAKSKKKSMTFGIIEMVIALFYVLIYFIDSTKVTSGYMLMSFGVFILGLFTFLYYPLIFTRKVDKMINKMYNELDYFHGDIKLEIFDDCCCEIVKSESNYNSFDMFVGIEESDNIIALMFNKTGGGLVIPKRSINNSEILEIKDFLRSKINKQ